MPRSGSARRRACSSSLARPAGALAPTVEALPLMVCRVAALPGHRPRRAGVRAGRRGPACPERSAATPGRSAPGCRRNARRYRPAPRPVRPRPLPLPARPGAAPAEMTEQAKHQALLVDRLRHMVVHARRQAASRSASEALAVMARIGSPAKRPSARILRVASRPSISGICMSISTASNGTPPAPAERPPARRRRGPPGRPRCSTARRRPGGSARCPPLPADARPATAGCAPPGAAAGWPGRLFAVQRMQHRVGQLLGRDRLGEKIDEGRRAVVARIGQHLAAIGGDHDHHGRRQVALQLADQLRRAEAVEIGMRQSISTTS